MHRTNIYLTDEQCALLERVARSRGTTRSDVVRDYVTQGLAVDLDGGDRVERTLALLDATHGVVGPDALELPDRSDGERAGYVERQRR